MNTPDAIMELRQDATALHARAFQQTPPHRQLKARAQDKLQEAKAMGQEALIEVSSAMEGPAWRNLIRAALTTDCDDEKTKSMLEDILGLNFSSPHSEDHLDSAGSLCDTASDVFSEAQVAS